MTHENTRIIRIFVSSPSDVEKEREALNEVVDRINKTDGRRIGFRLDVFEWTQVVPRIGPGPQQVIDGQTPQYDVYLAIFSSRFGTPTGQYGSGTEKEFRDALRQWALTAKSWILVYFNDDPPAPKGVEQSRQFMKLQEFRAEIESLGIIGTYKGVRAPNQGFFERVELHLRGLISLLHDAPVLSRGEQQRPVVSKAYLSWILSEYAPVELLGLKVKQGQAVRLNQIYVPLVTERMLDVNSPLIKQPLTLRDLERHQLLIEIVDSESLYVSGAPGSGKSTLCRWIAFAIAAGTFPSYDIPIPREYMEQYPASLGNHLPVLIRLRDFWVHQVRRYSGRKLTEAQFEGALQVWVNDTRPGGLEWPVLEAHLKAGTALLLLDGVDEIPLSLGEGPEQTAPREQWLTGLRASIPKWLKVGNRVIVTSRPYGMSESQAANLGIRHAPVAALPEPLQNLLVRRWFRILEEKPTLGDSIAHEMFSHVLERAEIDDLRANPMLLTAICIIYNEGRRLPQDKHDLYSRIVDNVLFNRYREDPKDIDRVHDRLRVVAFGMHTGSGLNERRKTPQAKASWDQVDRMLQAYADAKPFTEAAVKTAIEIREDLLSRSGLFLPQEERTAGFYHLSFQEFLAAERFGDVEDQRLVEAFAERADVAEWRNTLTFVFGAILARRSLERSIELLEQLIARAEPVHIGLQAVVAQCVDILLGKGIRLRPEHESIFVRQCLRAIETQVPVRERIVLSEALGRLGDPRLTDWNDPARWVTIPAGSFWMGAQRFEARQRNYDEEAEGSEKPVHEVKLGAFRIGRYLVTVSDFKEFVDGKGYNDEQWWKAGGFSQFDKPERWESQLQHPNRPIVGVSWFEASAFSNWANCRLPSEAEWERAARGIDGRSYPWGDESPGASRLNCLESQIGAPSPVGIYATSATPDGICDLAGNVFELCSDWYGQFDTAPLNPTGPTAGIFRVARGGSWGVQGRSARSAYRDFGWPPMHRDFTLGFRVVSSVPTAEKNQTSE